MSRSFINGMSPSAPPTLPSNVYLTKMCCEVSQIFITLDTNSFMCPLVCILSTFSKLNFISHMVHIYLHNPFIFIPIQQPSDDPAVNAMCEETEESKKVSRIGGRKYFAVFRRRSEAELLAQTPPLVGSLFT